MFIQLMLHVCLVTCYASSVPGVLSVHYLLGALCLLDILFTLGLFSEVGGGKKTKKRDKTTGDTAPVQDGEESDTVREGTLSQQEGGGERRPMRSKFKRETLWSRMVSCPESEDYLQWKEAILTAARARISQSAQ